MFWWDSFLGQILYLQEPCPLQNRYRQYLPVWFGIGTVLAYTGMFIREYNTITFYWKLYILASNQLQTTCSLLTTFCHSVVWNNHYFVFNRNINLCILVSLDWYQHMCFAFVQNSYLNMPIVELQLWHESHVEY